MSGIGDYIHYHHSRYLKYGVNAESGSNNFSESLADVHGWMQQQMKATAINVNLQELEKYYNNIIYSKGLTTLNTDIDDSDITLLQIITDFLQSTIEQTAQTTDVERALTQPTSSLRGKTDIDWDKKTISASDIANLIKSIKIARTNSMKMIQRAMNNPQNYLSFQKDKESLEEQCDYLLKRLHELEAEMQNVNSNKYTKAGKIRKNSNPTLNKDDIVTSLLKELRIFLNLYRGYYGSQLAGEGLEALFAAVNIGFNNTLITGYYNCMGDKKLWQNFLKANGKVGNNTVQVTYSNLSDIFIDKEALVRDYMKKYKWDMQSGDISLLGVGPKQTVDVIIKTEDNEDLKKILGEGNSLNASLKNLSDMTAYGINLLEDTNLLAILSYFSNADFANHYLNLYGVHAINGSSAQIDAQFKTANEAIKYMTALRALKGFGASSNLADILVVNNRQTKHLYIRSTGDILESAFNTGDIDKYFKFTGVPRMRNELLNPWIGASNFLEGNHKRVRNHNKDLAIQRITYFIGKVHQVKITCSLTPIGFFSHK